MSVQCHAYLLIIVAQFQQLSNVQYVLEHNGCIMSISTYCDIKVRIYLQVLNVLMQTCEPLFDL